MPARNIVPLTMDRLTAIRMAVYVITALLAVVLLGSGTSRAAEWKNYLAPDHSFSVDLPWPPKVQNRKGLIIMVAYPPSKKMSYIIASKELGASQASKPNQFFDAVLHALKSKSKARILSQERHRIHGHPVDDVKFLSKQGNYMWNRLIVTSDHFYQLMHVTPTKSARPARFWSSFKLPR